MKAVILLGVTENNDFRRKKETIMIHLRILDFFLCYMHFLDFRKPGKRTHKHKKSIEKTFFRRAISQKNCFTLKKNLRSLTLRFFNLLKCPF